MHDKVFPSRTRAALSYAFVPYLFKESKHEIMPSRRFLFAEGSLYHDETKVAEDR